MFKNGKFIKADYQSPKCYEEGDYAPIFSKKFFLKNKPLKSAILNICALGLGYAYINGQKVSNDLFCAPVSDYRKTIWYNTYEIGHLLKEGDNVISIIVGNGFYNENFPSAWDFDKIEWRDVPKVIAEIVVDGEVVASSDETWKVIKDSFITFNQYRSGEHFDARLFDINWTTSCCEDVDKYAVIDDKPPIGEFLQYFASPVQEVEVFSPIKIIPLLDGSIVVDFGVNMAGYVGINTAGANGEKITLKYAEEIDSDGNLKLNNLNCYAQTVPFQTCEIVCGNMPVYYKPYFTYFGFRFVQIVGVKSNLDKYEIKAFRIANNAKCTGTFTCSDEFINKLHDCATNSVQSNMLYNLTDCPTREKLGWTNDAATSAEHIFYVRDAHLFFEKWMRDIADTMRDDGALSGIAPSPDWGYTNGPVCDFAFFEIPYQDYIFTGSNELLKCYLPYYERYLEYLKGMESKGYVFPLADWMGYDNLGTSKLFITEVLAAYFYKILLIIQKDDLTRNEFEKRRSIIKEKYISINGESVENTQTAVSMLICFGFYDKLEPLKQQLKRVIEEKDFHLDVGLLGNKFIWLALDKCDLNDYAIKLIKAKGMPSFDYWISDGATSLYENWTKTGSVSENHHMFSAVNVFNYKTLGGIHYREPQNGKPVIEIKPYFAKEIDYVDCQRQTEDGCLKVLWKREDKKVKLSVFINSDLQAYYKGKKLALGENTFLEEV